LTVEELRLSDLEPLEQLRSQIRIKIEQARRAIQVQKANALAERTAGSPGDGGMIVETNDARLKKPRFWS